MQRWFLLAAGTVLTLIGILWTGQGAGWIGGSFMTGAKLWFLIGLGCLITGVGLILTGARRSRSKTG